ncbi:MAG: hypothetical protein QM704_17820 [Anaeromyxobacteraceae bacterium]
MTKPNDHDEPVPTPDPYELPPELPENPDRPLPEPDEDLDPALVKKAVGGGGSALKAGIAIAVVVLVGGALWAYRAHHKRQVVADGIAKAEALLRLDTAAGYRDAAAKLEPLAEIDDVGAASVRAFALAMLFADYRDPAAEDQAEALLVTPGRAEKVPAHASLAYAALALGRREAGNAATAASRAGDAPMALAIEARVALLAGNLEAGQEPAARAAAAELPAGLAAQGDLLRRSRKDLAGARAAYEAALVASPLHPRAALGLGKLALSGAGDPKTARAALERLLDDRNGTPGAERGRAALHLSALLLRAKEPNPFAPLDKAGITGPARDWAAAAARAAAEHEGPYRAVEGAPAPLQSASDDDPADLPPWRPPPPPPPAPPPKPAIVAKKGGRVVKATAAVAKAGAKTSLKAKTTTKAKATRKATAAKKPVKAVKKPATTTRTTR